MGTASSDSKPSPPNTEEEDKELNHRNPSVEIPCVFSIALLGFISRDERAARLKALARLEEVAAQHGISEFRWFDYFLAASLYSTLESHNSRLTPQSSSDNQLSADSSSALALSSQPGDKPQAPSPSDDSFYDCPSRTNESYLHSTDSALCATQPDSSQPNEKFCSQSSSSPEIAPCAEKVQSSEQIFKTKPNSVCLNSDCGDQNTSDPKLIGSQHPRKPDSLERDEICPKSVECNKKTNSIHTIHKADSSSSDATKTHHKETTSHQCSSDSNEYSNANLTDGDRGPKMVHMNVDHIQLLYHMLRHADGIYGLPHTIVTSPGISITRLTDKNIICRRTGINSNDLLVTEHIAGAFMPACYVAVDKRVRAIVVCIRGTANIIDVLTDVAATQESFEVELQSSSETEEGITHHGAQGKFTGFAHSGFLRSAKNVLLHVREVVKRATQDYPEFTVITTGHSLGATTAAMLALLMRNKGGFPNAMGVVFAPAPCLSHELAELTAPFVVTIINGPDMVPRLSVPLLLSLFATIRYIGKLSRARKLLLALGQQENIIDWEEFNQFVESCKDEWRELHHGNRVFIPGRVFQLIRRGAANHKWYQNTGRDGNVDIFRVSREKFLQVHTKRRGMQSAHGPVCYRRSLYLALKDQGQKPVSRNKIDDVVNRLTEQQSIKQVWAQISTGPDPCVSFSSMLATEGNEST